MCATGLLAAIYYFERLVTMARANERSEKKKNDMN